MNKPDLKKIRRKYFIASIPVFTAIIFYIIASFVNLKGEVRLGLTTLILVIGLVLTISTLVYDIKSGFKGYKNDLNDHLEKQNNLMMQFHSENSDLIRTASHIGNYHIVDSVESLQYIALSINQYVEIYNIRLNPRNKTPFSLQNATDDWRKALKKRFDRPGELKIREIVAYDKKLLAENEELFAYYLNTKKNFGEKNYKVNYRYVELKLASRNRQLTNFILLKTRNNHWDLFWGWHELTEEKGNMSKYLTYHTSHKETVKDYLKRFETNYQGKREKK
ncbi:hypothetical protein [Aquimarina macrocephali]|uniref:hypothetical protein n=1 Tax=Aquimarina macrocephali TaxID=666563 RepID=UPI000467CD32|nr:hypothetical protein [Aquimarina macrocephali]